ncbi:MAG: hypothetical protein WB776_21750, partial [Candidatus Sulfotelmatobacter sp.]
DFDKRNRTMASMLRPLSCHTSNGSPVRLQECRIAHPDNVIRMRQTLQDENRGYAIIRITPLK